MCPYYLGVGSNRILKKYVVHSYQVRSLSCAVETHLYSMGLTWASPDVKCQ